jgi:hypothetical protein
MVKVYFETSMHSELVGIFTDERAYNACVLTLKRLCKDMGYTKMTESIDDSETTESLIKVIERI